ncbi:MAG: DUF1232 domain-containing protein [bacterium]|nr:DUF1232 domain-containing protein [bacterium]
MPAASRPMRPVSMRLLLQLPRQVRLCWRLLGERRVTPWSKMVLLAALLYLILPFDLVPDILVGPGQLDDLGLLVAAGWWFVHQCPPDVVAEHLRAIDGDAAG